MAQTLYAHMNKQTKKLEKNCQLGNFFSWFIPVIPSSSTPCQLQDSCCPFLPSWCTYFWISLNDFRFLLGEYCEFFNILIATRIAYLHLLHRIQAREVDNTLQICWFYMGRCAFCLGLPQLHWAMDFHFDQKLVPWYLKDKRKVNVNTTFCGIKSFL
jgi:hypothetical protein